LNDVKIQLAISGLATAVALAGTLIAAPRLGVRGAAAALLAAELVVGVSTVVVLRRTFASLGMHWPQQQVVITATSLATSCLLIAWGSQTGAPARPILAAAIALALVGCVALIASLPASVRIVATSFLAGLGTPVSLRRKNRT
jgi:hypothetical protein